MARFKVNDLITNGSETLWVTEITDTRYVFTDQDGYHSTRRFEQIDSCFRLYEPKKIWHKVGEEPPIKGKEALVEYGNDYHDVGFYDEETKSFQIGIEEYVEMDSVERWAYLEDLVDL